MKEKYKSDGKPRCGWSESNALMTKYHDEEWGVPVFDDKKLFEFIVLDTFQAGLSWNAVLQKRENFRKAFSDFDAVKISKYNEKKITELINDAGIIRNKLKINSTVINAQNFLRLKNEHGTFSKYIWQFTKGKTITNKWKAMSEVPPATSAAEAMSKDLYKQGFKFVGPTICYAFMQAAGMVNDHLVSCFRYKKV